MSTYIKLKNRQTFSADMSDYKKILFRCLYFTDNVLHLDTKSIRLIMGALRFRLTIQMTSQTYVLLGVFTACMADAKKIQYIRPYL